MRSTIDLIRSELDSIPVTERAWAAGFFDGEGCFYVRNRQDRNKQARHKYPYLSITQVRIEPLTRLQKALGGGGRIYFYERVEKNWQDKYLLQIYRKKDVLLALVVMKPFLSPPKIEQIRSVLKEVRGNGFFFE